MKKVLEITVDRIDMDKGTVVFHISRQSHKNDQFGKEFNYFNAKNGVFLFSSYYPSCNVIGYLYVQGHSTELNNECLCITFSEFARLLEAIKEYNDFEFPEEKHEIVIDGKTVEISKESYEALKNSLIK
jgi:hypothetical protein